MTDIDLDTLDIDCERLRALGYRVVDMIVDHHRALPGKPATRCADRATLRDLLHEPAPAGPCDPEEVLDIVENHVLPFMSFANHPRFFAYIPGPANPIGALADALASGFNVINTLWLESSAPAQLELTALDWLRQWCGLPAGAGGLFVSGGSVANLTALAVARRISLDNDFSDAVVYASDQTHGSLDKNLRLLGLDPGRLVRITSDDSFRLDVERLERRVRTDAAAGLRPFCVIANAGTTNTGAVDPLADIGALCRRLGMWLHVDGAYGAPALLTDRGRHLMRGLERADSIAIDPHKWLFQPFEIGCCLVRDARWLPRTFGQAHEYMQDGVLDATAEEVNFCDRGIQLTRGFRALKFWMTVKTFGVDAIRAAIDRGMDLAEYAESRIACRDCFEIISPARLAVVGFRYIEDSDDARLDALNLSIVDAVLADGGCMISSTRLRGRTSLRLCTINPRTTREDIDETIDLIAGKGLALSAA